LIYWSYSQTAKGSWPELNHARSEFGEAIKRSSEPDLIAVTDKALFFIEVKLKASNETLPSDPNNRKKYLTGGEGWFNAAFTSDFENIAIKSQKYELLRFWLLGTWLSAKMSRDFYLINIVPDIYETDIEERFVPQLKLTDKRHFKRLAWEDVSEWICNNAPENTAKEGILDYFQNKTVGYDQFGLLQKAFSRKI